MAVSIEMVGCSFLAFETVTLSVRNFKGQKSCKVQTGSVCGPRSICRD